MSRNDQDAAFLARKIMAQTKDCNGKGDVVINALALSVAAALHSFAEKDRLHNLGVFHMNLAASYDRMTRQEAEEQAPLAARQ